MSNRINLYESTHAGKTLAVWQDKQGQWWMEIDVAVLPSAADCQACAQMQAHAHLHHKFSNLLCLGDPHWVAVASSLPHSPVRAECKAGRAGMRTA